MKKEEDKTLEHKIVSYCKRCKEPKFFVYKQVDVQGQNKTCSLYECESCETTYDLDMLAYLRKIYRL